MLDQVAILMQIAEDTRAISQLLTVFASDYLAPVFERHPELPSGKAIISIDNSHPGAPIIEVHTHFNMPDPNLSVLKLQIPNSKLQRP